MDAERPGTADDARRMFLRPSARWQRVLDLALCLAVAAPLSINALVLGSRTAASGLAVGLVVPAAALPLLWRRRWPVGVLAVELAVLIAVELHPPVGFPAFGLLAALYTVASLRPRRVSLAAAAATALSILPFAELTSWVGATRAGFQLSLCAMAWAVGEVVRLRRAELAALEARAAHAVAEEQARIARELHDVIAHNVSVMVVQAAAADDVFDAHPHRAREALRSIEATGREAMTELRRLIGGVRGPEAEAQAMAPQPGLARLDALAEQVRAAGLPVTVTIEGAPRALPAGVDLSAFRIVQEALTNALRHARATRADVRLRYRPTTVAIEVSDDGVGPPPGLNGTGHGLVGMRERVALLRGELELGRAPGGGFRVAARLPVQEAGS
jgi:signal transduction histidine kinase